MIISDVRSVLDPEGIVETGMNHRLASVLSQKGILKMTNLMKCMLAKAMMIPILIGCSAANGELEPTIHVTSVSNLKWEKLNPARGDKSPQAATLWGNRQGMAPTGFLVKFVDGFSSPPHIHNVSYRGIVISGQVHNDDPSAEKMWMPPGSYWTQPAGEPHITSAKGELNIAFIEIDNGPYLVKPKDKAFDNGERPFNIHRSNIIWRIDDDIRYVPLWKSEKDQVTGTLMEVEKTASIQSKSGKLVVIVGEVSFINGKSGDSGVFEGDPNDNTEDNVGQALAPGSFAEYSNTQTLSLGCFSETPCQVYIKSDDTVNVI
jgi:mannose-6-phosphate isomerase-like protein (cupin superfamily)